MKKLFKKLGYKKVNKKDIRDFFIESCFGAAIGVMLLVIRTF
jgi:hypothetical protein